MRIVEPHSGVGDTNATGDLPAPQITASKSTMILVLTVSPVALRSSTTTAHDHALPWGANGRLGSGSAEGSQLIRPVAASMVAPGSPKNELLPVSAGPNRFA